MSIQHMQMVFDAGDLTSAEKSVLLAYCNFTDAHGYCWPGVERIADMTGFSEKTVKNVRKALKERNLLRSSARVERSGRRKTDISRINLTKLASLKLPPREYKDNVIAELEFEDEETPEPPAEQPKGTTCPKPDQPKGSSYPHQGKQVPLQEGEAVTPYPSGDPSGEPSSSSVTVEDITNIAAPKQRTKKRMSPEEVIKTRLPEEHITDDEAKSMADLIDRRGAGGGQPIRSLATWITNRDERELRRDLESIRLIERSAEVEYTGMENCALHSMKIVGGACSSCMGDIKAGDRAAVREHALMAGPKYRPDLFQALGMPPGGPEGASSGARARVPDHNFWKHVTDSDFKRLAL